MESNGGECRYLVGESSEGGHGGGIGVGFGLGGGG